MAGLDAKELLAKYKKIKASGGGGNYLRLEDGVNRVRIVPFHNEETGKPQLFVEAFSHFISKGSETCLKSVNESCPICNYVKELDAEKTKESKKLARELYQRKRFYFNVLHDGELKVLECGNTIAEGLLSFVADEEYGVAVFDLEDGYDFKIEKSGQGLKTEYLVKIAKEPSAVKLPGKPKDLTTILKPKTEEELEDVLKETFEMTATDGEEGEEDTSRSHRRAVEKDDEEDDRKSRRRKDDEDDEPKSRRREEPEDDDEPTPKKKSRVVDEEEDDEPKPKRKHVTEEEDDEPAPKKKTKISEEEADDAVASMFDRKKKPAPKRR